MEKVTLHIYWDDNVTVELRYFPNQKKAEEYAKKNVVVDYIID